jgi:ABC-type nickel/cobalt efflux system permease component RcnA
LEHPLIPALKKLVMKNRVAEAFFSLLALYLISCGIAAAIFLGMLLVPVVFVALFVLAVRQLISRKRKTQQSGQRKGVIVERTITAIIRRMPPFKKAA